MSVNGTAKLMDKLSRVAHGHQKIRQDKLAAGYQIEQIT